MQYRRARTQHERGRAGFGTLIVLIMLVVSIYTAIQIIRVYNKHWTFEEDVNELVRFAVTNFHGEIQQHITDQIIDMLDCMGAQYDRDQIRVNVDEHEATITVDVWYSQSLKLPFFPQPKQFYISVRSG